MLKKVCATAAAAAFVFVSTLAPAHADLRRSGQATWSVIQGRLGLKIGANPGIAVGDTQYCSSDAVMTMIHEHYPYDQNVQFVGSISSLIGRMTGQWGGAGDSDGVVYADFFDCGIKLPGKTLTGAICIGLDIMQPMGTRYCGFGTQE